MEYKTKTFANNNECLQIPYIIIKATPWSLFDKWCGFKKYGMACSYFVCFLPSII